MDNNEYSNDAAQNPAVQNDENDASRPFASRLKPRRPDPFKRELPQGAVARGAAFSDEAEATSAFTPSDFATNDFAQVPELAPLADGGPLADDLRDDEIPTPPEYSDRWQEDESADEPNEEMAVQRFSGGEPPDDIPPISSEDSSEDEFPSTEAPRDRELDIWEHLGELRTRLLYCVAAIALGMAGTWAFRDALLDFFARPVVQTLKLSGKGVLQTLNPAEGLVIYLQITFVAAVVLTAPFLLWQVWKFIEPALMPHERRYAVVIVPFSTILFFLGCALGFYMTPLFFKFFLDFTPPGAASNWAYRDTVTLLAKMLLVFGVSFQVPIVTIFLMKVGLVSRNFLIEYWRHIVLVIFVVVAVITPTWDPVSLMAAALPPCLLYALSLWIVKWL
jgi:sec-independent protein translocase protein TatC